MLIVAMPVLDAEFPMLQPISDFGKRDFSSQSRHVTGAKTPDLIWRADEIAKNASSFVRVFHPKQGPDFAVGPLEFLDVEGAFECDWSNSEYEVVIFGHLNQHAIV